MSLSLLEKLREVGKVFYTFEDIKKITGYSSSSIYVVINRLIGKRKLMRLRGGIYVLPERYKDIDIIANQIYFPSYFSFEGALSRYGLISQIPYTLTYAVFRKTKKLRLGNYMVEYRMIKRELFFDYVKLDNGLFIATAEKGLFDMIYISLFGKVYFNFDDVDIRGVDFERFRWILRRSGLGKRYVERINRVVGVFESSKVQEVKSSRVQ